MKTVLKEEIIKSSKNGNIVVMPTDTVYGLMIKATGDNEHKLNIFKKCDINKKVSIIFDSVETLLENMKELPEDRIQMIKDKLPGKYTFIVDLKDEYTKANGFERSDFGVRVTGNKELQSILKETGPMLATSCNYSKEDICVTLEDIKRIFKDEDIDVYFTEDGTNTPSTIIDLTKEKINVIR